MKLRIRGNSIRFRLSKGEVAEFADTGSIENHIEFGDGHKLSYVLKTSDSMKSLHSHFENGRIEISVPKSSADFWAKTEEVGISGNHNSLKISIEKDFACLTARENEDQTDSFPHPKMKEESC